MLEGVVTDPNVPPNRQTPQTSSTLLYLVQQHDGEAWERFVALYTPLVYRWCRDAGLQDADAADVGQDVFGAVARKVGSFHRDPARGTFRGWLKTITRNKVRDHARRTSPGGNGVGGSDAQVALNALPDPAAEADSPDDPETAACEEVVLMRRAVEMILADLPESKRAAFVRVVGGGEDPAAVAREFGTTPNVIYIIKSRVKRRLREEFADLLDLEGAAHEPLTAPPQPPPGSATR